jgi:hypothetical protein
MRVHHEETIHVAGWPFMMKTIGDERFVTIPDRGGMADMVPSIPEQHAWAESVFNAIPSLTQVWPTSWRVPDEALPAVRALLEELRRVPPPAAVAARR